MSTLLDLYKIASEDDRNRGAEAGAGAAALGLGGISGYGAYKKHEMGKRLEKSLESKESTQKKLNIRGSDKRVKKLKKLIGETKPKGFLNRLSDSLFGGGKRQQHTAKLERMLAESEEAQRKSPFVGKNIEKLKNLAKKTSMSKAGLGLLAGTGVATGGGLLYDAARNKDEY